MKLLRKGMVLLAASALPFGANAQEAKPGKTAEAPADEAIIVTGKRITDDAVADFVKAVTVETSGAQLAAFRAPICPMSMGLPDAFNRVIEQRIRAVAEEAGIDVAKEGCSPNVTVLVTDDGPKLISRLRSTHPSMFQDRDASMNRSLVGQPGPARAWQVIEARGSDGRPVQRVNFVDLRPLIPGIPPSWAAVVATPRGKYLDGVIPSRITRSTRQDISLSFVVIDVAAIDGLSLAQVADYAAMRALAQTDPKDARTTGQPTILTLFDDRKSGEPPADAITPWDQAFLKSLYKTRRTISAGLQRANMARIVRGELDAPDGTKPDQQRER